jgi:hypothetical protein
LGIGGDVPVPDDYDGDGQTDLAVYRPSTGNWIIRFSNGGNIGGTYYTSMTKKWGGFIGDVPVPGDYDGDGKADVAIFRPSSGTWFILQSSTNFTGNVNYSWGMNGDVPLPNIVTTTAAARNAITTSTLANLAKGSDFDVERDGRSDMSVFRPSTKLVYTLLSRGGFTNNQTSGAALNSTDIPVPGNYLGWGIMDFASFYRPSDGMWYSTGADTQWGVSTDTPVPGDYDGDGRMDLAVYRPSTGTFFILKSSTNFSTNIVVPWGMAGDIPVPGEFDGDGKTDVAIFRPSTGAWWVLQSSTNFTTAFSRNWGLNTDIPILGRH